MSNGFYVDRIRDEAGIQIEPPSWALFNSAGEQVSEAFDRIEDAVRSGPAKPPQAKRPVTATSMYALVYGNNFYLSCERVFRPSLQGRLVIVLSNNDGCAIARSNQAKPLGIAMGAPSHLIQREPSLKDAGVLALSANFTLYGDMSNWMMSIAAGLGPGQEIYSIEESFIAVDGIRDVTRRAQAVRERILQWTGIPCGIGIGPTKTLAKLANHVAKSAADAIKWCAAQQCFTYYGRRHQI